MAKQCMIARNDGVYTLSSAHMNAATWQFSDRPYRINFAQPTVQYFLRFDKTYAESAPNAAITFTHADDLEFEGPLVAVFVEAAYMDDENRFTYVLGQNSTVAGLDAVIGEGESVLYDDCTIFIDSAPSSECGWNVNLVNYLATSFSIGNVNVQSAGSGYCYPGCGSATPDGWCESTPYNTSSTSGTGCIVSQFLVQPQNPDVNGQFLFVQTPDITCDSGNSQSNNVWLSIDLIPTPNFTSTIGLEAIRLNFGGLADPTFSGYFSHQIIGNPAIDFSPTGFQCGGNPCQPQFDPYVTFNLQSSSATFYDFITEWIEIGSGEVFTETKSITTTYGDAFTASVGFTVSLQVGASVGFEGFGDVSESLTTTFSTSISNTVSEIRAAGDAIACQSVSCVTGVLFQWQVTGTSTFGPNVSVTECDFVCVDSEYGSVKPKCPKNYCVDQIGCQCCNGVWLDGNNNPIANNMATIINGNETGGTCVECALSGQNCDSDSDCCIGRCLQNGFQRTCSV